MRAADSARLDRFKSSYSGNEGGECLEVAVTPARVHVRDSKNPGRAQLAFSAGSWGTFVRSAAVR